MVHQMVQILSILLLSVPTFGLLGSKKNITATGILQCGGKPYPGATVELWDDDTFNFDDKLDSTHSDRGGKFRLFGEAREIRSIEPYLLVIHNCDNGKHDVRCTFTDRYNIPKSYQGMTYNLGEVDLKTATMKRKRKCY